MTDFFHSLPLEAFIPALILLPFAGFVITFVFGRYIGDKEANILATSAVGFSFLMALALFGGILTGGSNLTNGAIHNELYTWIGFESFNIKVAFLFDRLSGLFTLVITGIGFLIHVYSIGYMDEEDNTFRFFSYLNLFVFFMLVLVLSDNLMGLLVGWEGVGLCSYLLIGYYGAKSIATSAARKAFVMNRIGDFGLFAAIFIAFYAFSSLTFSEINSTAVEQFKSGQLDPGLTVAFLLAIFLACCGKSAQFPLFTWLPDAMEAPTPVSALIHAATMVTAGIYLIARLGDVFMLSELVLGIIMVVGIFTALIAAVIALTQNDIKKVLAYSTVSQLGYMFVAMGAGAFEIGVLHMFTHAFFKALLFLGAGSVILSLHHEQDMRKMGNLAGFIPRTALCFGIGTYAISGLPLAAGFFSKDEVLWYTFNSTYGSPIVWFVGVVTSFLTAFYMYRLYYRIFYGKTHFADLESVHESPNTVLFPLYILAFFSVFAGFLAVPHYLNPISEDNIWHLYFKGFFSKLTLGEYSTNHIVDFSLLIFTALVAIAGCFLARHKYNNDLPKFGFSPGSTAYRLSENKFYLDEIYQAVFVKPVALFSFHIFRRMTESLVMLVVKVVTDTMASVHRGLLRQHSGAVSHYALFVLLFFVISIFILL